MAATLEALPSLAVCKILSFLSWSDKLWMSENVTEWHEHLCSVEAWPTLQYEETACTNKQQILACLSIYGRYINHITFCFKKQSNMHMERVLQAVGKYCCNLKIVRIHNLHFCMDSLSDLFAQMLVRCSKLDDVQLFYPETYLCSRGNVVNILAAQAASKITALILHNGSFDGHDGVLHILQNFKCLRKLRIRRQELSFEVLLGLAKCNLQNLSLFKDEECLLGEPLVYTSEMWQQILALKPDFKTNLILSNIVVLKTMFPALAPLQAIIFVDLSATLTKGKIDLIAEYYNSTLEIFVYTHSNTYQSAQMTDRRLPKSLPHLVNACKKLKSLVYGYEISSTTILLLGNQRRMKHLVIAADELSYEMDSVEDWSPSFINWLQQNGSDMKSLELEISNLFQYKWRLANNNEMKEAVEYYSML